MRRMYTFLLLLLSLLVVIGGWFFTAGMLDRCQRDILSGSRVVKGAGTPSFLQNQGEFQETVLSEKEMCEILKVWKEGGKEQPQEPGEGQMDMNQAITAGREWITGLAAEGFLPDILAKGRFDKTSAILYTLDKEVPFERGLLGVWKIQYKREDVGIKLTIHAATGQVWGAEITMNEDRLEFRDIHQEEFLQAALPFGDLAQMRMGRIQISGQKQMFEMVEWKLWLEPE